MLFLMRLKNVQMNSQKLNNLIKKLFYNLQNFIYKVPIVNTDPFSLSDILL